ncbi:dihydrodipicolinate synthase family protein [Dactylosporangium sp. NPDC000555]|uniref:dihydrodipicolinate synthase family protein n=1 Tax=Dactylosporangium sp. NPDC000555 TaxID=3154260 RepID=UPI003317D2EE
MVVLTTPFDENLEIDEAGLRSNVNHLVALECVGSLYVGGIYQEAQSLTFAEQKRVIEIVLSEVAGRKPVMVNTGMTAIAETVELTQHAQEQGADLAMIFPPLLGARTRQGVIDYYRTVARSVDMGLALYNTTLKENGFYIDVSMLEEILNEENYCALKEASFSPSTYLDTLQRLGKDIVVSCPVEEWWIYGRTMLPDYAADVLLATSRPLYLQTDKKPYLSNFLDAARSGNSRDIAAALQQVLKVADPIHNSSLKTGSHNPALTKAVTEMMGMVSGPVRPPLSWPEPAALAEAREALEAAGLIDTYRAPSATS